MSDLPSLRRFQVAVLLNRHKLPLSEIMRMTPAQISNLAFHPRDDKGALKPPGIRRSKTLQEELSFFRSMKGWDSDENREHRERVERRIYERHGATWPS